MIITRREWRVLKNIYSACIVLQENQSKGYQESINQGHDSPATEENADLKIHLTVDDKMVNALKELGEEMDSYVKKIEEQTGKVVTVGSLTDSYGYMSEEEFKKLAVNVNGMIPPGLIITEEERQKLVKEKLQELARVRQEAINLSKNFSKSKDGGEKEIFNKMVNGEYKHVNIKANKNGAMVVDIEKIGGETETVCAECYQKICEVCYICHNCLTDVDIKQIHNY